MENVLLDDIELEAVQVVDLTEKTTVPEHRVEKQFSISDHIILEPAEFSIEATIDTSTKQRLEALRDSKKLFTFVSELHGTYDNMVVLSLSFRPLDLSNLQASIHIKQIRVAETKTVSIPISVTPSEEEVKGSTPPTNPLDGWMARHFEEYKKEVPEQPQQSLLDKALGFVNWLTGGLFGGV
ncbi:phage baseplate protein [Archaeoglobus sp. JdFR-39]|uniref:phage baseplate protein n=1 Tax=Archaeoglobus sp. JdFR-39 TaxID=1934996 RepID=UPI0025C1C7A9|nr:hypothetical protein [Archaeoglobus sp. JdFR-39]